MKINRFEFHSIDELKLFTDCGPIIVRFTDESARKYAEKFIRRIPVVERLPGVVGQNLFDVSIISENSRMDRQRMKDWKQRPARSFKTAKAPKKSTEFKTREDRVLSQEARPVRQSGGVESTQDKQVERVARRLTSVHFID